MGLIPFRRSPYDVFGIFVSWWVSLYMGFAIHGKLMNSQNTLPVASKTSHVLSTCNQSYQLLCPSLVMLLIYIATDRVSHICIPVSSNSEMPVFDSKVHSHTSSRNVSASTQALVICLPNQPSITSKKGLGNRPQHIPHHIPHIDWVE